MKRLFHCPILSLLIIAALVLPVAASAAKLPAPLRQGLEQLSVIGGFSCSFEQQLLFADGTRQTYSGTLAVRRPMRFRWHYTRPYEQLYVSDGMRIWHYEPDLMQVRVLRHLDEIDPVVMHLLDGSVGLDDMELIAADAGRRRYHVRIGNADQIWLELGPHGQLSTIESVDVLGNRNRIRLLGIHAVRPPESTFTFTIPPGVDVVEENG